MAKENIFVSDIRRSRESGNPKLLADQSHETIRDEVKSNVGTVIALCQRLPDVGSVLKTLGLDSSYSNMLMNLPVGCGIVKRCEGFPYPVKVNFPEIKIKYFTDKQIDKFNAEDETLQNLLSKVKRRQTPEQHTNEEPKSIQLTDKMKRWLITVGLFQGKRSITEINEIVGLPNSTCSEIAKGCVELGLVEMIEIQLGNKKLRYPHLTQKGEALTGVPTKKVYSKGAGKKHSILQQRVAGHFARYSPIIEKNLNGKFADIVIKMNNQLIIFEIEMTDAWIAENIRKDIDAGAFRVVTACADKSVLNKAHQKILDLPDKYRGKASIHLVSDILNQDPEKFLEGLSSEQNLSR